MTRPVLDATKGRPVRKPKLLTAEWYVLSLLDDGRWVVVDNSDPAHGWDKPKTKGGYAEPIEVPKPEVRQLGPQAAMEASARQRNAEARRILRERFGRDPDDFAIEFVAVDRDDASEMTGIRRSPKPTPPQVPGS